MNATKHPFYTIWANMRQRCRDVNHPQYKDYGGRGIKVCKRWDLDFWAFVEDMGEMPPSPPRWTLDRIKNHLGYSPANCKWATYKEQQANKRAHPAEKTYLYKGRQRTMRELAQLAGTSYMTMKRRILVRKWSIEDAVKAANNRLQRLRKPL